MTKTSPWKNLTDNFIQTIGEFGEFGEFLEKRTP
jgi:hypothetical protein